MGLVECKFRGQQKAAARWECSSPNLHTVPPQGVTAEQCAACPIPRLLSGKPAVNLVACPWHGETCRDSEGRAVERECQSCGGKLSRQVLFNCTHAEQPMGRDVIVADCARCRDRPT